MIRRPPRSTLFPYTTPSDLHTEVEMVKAQLLIVAAAASAVAAFSPLSADNVAADRRAFLKSAGAAVVASAGVSLVPSAALAEVVVPPQFTEYEFPNDWGLTYNYDQDAAKVRGHMVTATGLGKGAKDMEDYGKNLKKEMVDFVSYYRRFPKVAGKPSFSTLYTSINVLAGHYTSYGYKYPLPEKRRKRLYQEYAEIEKSLKRGR